MGGPPTDLPATPFCRQLTSCRKECLLAPAKGRVLSSEARPERTAIRGALIPSLPWRKAEGCQGIWARDSSRDRAAAPPPPLRVGRHPPPQAVPYLPRESPPFRAGAPLGGFPGLSCGVPSSPPPPPRLALARSLQPCPPERAHRGPGTWARGDGAGAGGARSGEREAGTRRSPSMLRFLLSPAPRRTTRRAGASGAVSGGAPGQEDPRAPAAPASGERSPLRRARLLLLGGARPLLPRC